jgi:hypothetical protein
MRASQHPIESRLDRGALQEQACASDHAHQKGKERKEAEERNAGRHVFGMVLVALFERAPEHCHARDAIQSILPRFDYGAHCSILAGSTAARPGAPSAKRTRHTSRRLRRRHMSAVINP